MANYVIDSADFRVAARAALFGGRQERIRLLNIAETLDGVEPADLTTALVNVGNPEPAQRDAAFDNLSEAATAAE